MNRPSKDNEHNAPEAPTEGPGIAIPLLNTSQTDSLNKVATELMSSDSAEEERHDPISNTASEILGSESPEEERHDPVANAALDVIQRDNGESGKE